MLPQMQFLPYLRLAGITEPELRWLGRPINAAVGQKQLLVRLEQAELETAGSGVANADFHFSKETGSPRRERWCAGQAPMGVTSGPGLIVNRTRFLTFRMEMPPCNNRKWTAGAENSMCSR